MGFPNFFGGGDDDALDPLDVKHSGYSDRELMAFADPDDEPPPYFEYTRLRLRRKAQEAAGVKSNRVDANSEVSSRTDPTSLLQGNKTNNNSEGDEVQPQPQRNLDRRVRLRPKNGAEGYVYGDELQPGLLTVLRQTNGLVFPVTPTINETHSVSYSAHSPSHSISKFNNYENTDNVQLQIVGDFHVTNATEARYLLACIHFLRSVTKMDFGTQSETRGTPPPILLFSGYGNFMYNDIPVIVKNVNFSFESDIDYVQVPLSGTQQQFQQSYQGLEQFYQLDTDKEHRVWVPTKLTISMTLEQQTTPEWLTNEFNLEKFKRGELLTKGGLI